jgi:hypothetical protein
MGPARMRLRGRRRGCRGGCGGGDETLEQLDFVERSLGIAGGGFYDFEGYMTI